MLPGRSFHRPEKTIPTVAVKHSGVFFFGEPDKRGFADQMVLRNESEQARISQVNGVVGSHPIIIFGENAPEEDELEEPEEELLDALEWDELLEAASPLTVSVRVLLLTLQSL